MTIEMVPIGVLIQDMTLYPRHRLDKMHIRNMRRSLEAGCEMPPVIADHASKRLIDGFHRVEAYKRHKATQVPVEWHDYTSEAEMFLDAARRNAIHGDKLTPWDRVRCIVRCEELGISVDQVADALHITVGRVEQLRARTAFDPSNTVVPIKAAISHMAGTKLTPRQYAALSRVGGNQYKFYATQLIEAAEAELLDLSDPLLVARLYTLIDTLRNALPRRKKAVI